MLYLFIFCLDQYLFFQHQIEKLIIKLTSNIDGSTIDDILDKKGKILLLFIKCCTKMNRLKHLNFSSANNNEQSGFYVHDPYSFTSNISELHVCVDTLDDCLTILDNQLNQMNKFYVIINGEDCQIRTSHTTVSCLLI
jgi:hypothetical protein